MKLARIYNDGKLLIEGELIENKPFSLKPNGDLHIGELIEGFGDIARIKDNKLYVGELIENVDLNPPIVKTIKGLELWLDASYLSLEEGARVSHWEDLSGNGNHAVNSDVTSQPTFRAYTSNGLPGVYFDGSVDPASTLFFPRLSDIRTVFWVMNEDPQATGFDEFILADSESHTWHRQHFGTPYILNGSQRENQPLINGETYLNGELIDPTRVVFPKDLTIMSMTTTENVAASNLTRHRNYTHRSWWGHIRELLIYNRPLSTAEREAVEEYLHRKWWVPEPVNLSENASVTASSVHSDFAPRNVIDGNTSDDKSRWVSAIDDDAPWIELDLSDTCRVIRFEVFNGHVSGSSHHVSEYTIQYYSEGSWIDIVTVSDNTAHHRVHEVDPIRTNKIRIAKLQSGHNRFYEIQVWGNVIE